KNRGRVEEYQRHRPDIIVGGTGYDYMIKLPPEIDSMQPKINYGFTTRGCIRKCAFCFVPASEGAIRPTGDIYDIWDGKAREIELLDNNIMALPEHFETICKQAMQLKIKIDFNQGLDYRFLTSLFIYLLKRVTVAEPYFAFDNPAEFRAVDKAITLLQQNGMKRTVWFVLVGFDTTLKQDLERLNHLKERGQRAYVMRYSRDRKYIPLARWANQRNMFAGTTFEQFCKQEGYAETGLGK
ncbi:hypothetical protein LCGC14_2993350, partial [marine sediment metagenome]